MEIIVVGSLNMDLVIRSERQVRPGETIYGYGFRTICGGKGANQALACARLGALTSMVGCVGDDDFGKRLKNELSDDGVNCSCVHSLENVSTGIALINVLDSGENSIILDSGANALLDENILNASAFCKPESSGFVLFQLEIPIPSVIAGMRMARAAGYRTILTPAPAQPLPDEAWELVDILALNEYELEFYSKGGNLHDKGVGMILATHGERGGVVSALDSSFSYNAVKVDAVDTTAAGDTFCAAVAVGLGEGMDIEHAVKFAAAASALTCTKMGASASLPYRADVEKFMQSLNI